MTNSATSAETKSTADEQPTPLHEAHDTSYTVEDLAAFMRDREQLTYYEYALNPDSTFRQPPERLDGRPPLYLEDIRRDTTEEGIPYTEADYSDDPFEDDAQDWCTLTYIEYANVPTEMVQAAVDLVDDKK